MIQNEIIEPLNQIMETEEANSLCLSKGGWEGWLQCELWSEMSLRRFTVEREKKYPTSNDRCDLVYINNARKEVWVEIKAYGIYREERLELFMDAIAQDVYKLVNKPQRADGLVLVVVPNRIAGHIDERIRRRGWQGVDKEVCRNITLYYLNL